MTVLDRVITLIVLVILHAIISFFTIGLWAISKVINLLLEGASRSAFSEFLGEEAGKGMGFVINQQYRFWFRCKFNPSILIHI